MEMKLKHRLLSMVLSLLMVLSLIPATVFAADESTTAVAKIGDIEYETIAKAVTAAKDGDTIMLLNDVDLGSSSVKFYNSSVSNLTFDLGGHTITSSGSSTVLVAYDGLVIKNGTIANTNAKSTSKAVSAQFTAQCEHSLTLEGVTVNSSNGVGVYATMLKGNGTVTIKSGTVISGNIGVQVEGTIGGNPTSSAGTVELTVEDGTITGTKSGLYIVSSSKYKNTSITANIVGGYISGGDYGIRLNSGGASSPDTIVNISGGTISSEGTAVSHIQIGTLTISGSAVINGNVNTNEGTTVITGGTVNGNVTKNASAGVVSISGGKFDRAFDTAFLAEGCTYDESTGTVKSANAEINGTKYATLAEAVKAANAGDTIILLNDVELTSAQSISKRLTIDLNGKTLSSKAYRTLELKAGADLTVKDSAGGGKVANTYSGSSYPATVYLNGAGAKFTLESGIIESDPNETSLQSTAINSEKNKACEVNIKGGSVVVPEAATNGRAIVASSNSMTLNISGGTIAGGLHGVDAYSGLSSVERSVHVLQIPLRRLYTELDSLEQRMLPLTAVQFPALKWMMTDIN